MANAEIVVHRPLIDAPEHLSGIDGVVLRGIARESLLAAGEPAHRAAARRFAVLPRRGNADALVKRHGDIRAEIGLNAHTLLGSHEDMPTVHMGIEVYALFLDLAQLRKGKDLESAGVGQDRSVPAHELMQPAHIADQLVARADVEMVGVGKLDLAADLAQVIRGEAALDRRLRADVHEYRRLHRAVRRGVFAPSGVSFELDSFIHLYSPYR